MRFLVMLGCAAAAAILFSNMFDNRPSARCQAGTYRVKVMDQSMRDTFVCVTGTIAK